MSTIHVPYVLCAGDARRARSSGRRTRARCVPGSAHPDVTREGRAPKQTKSRLELPATKAGWPPLVPSILLCSPLTMAATPPPGLRTITGLTLSHIAHARTTRAGGPGRRRPLQNERTATAAGSGHAAPYREHLAVSPDRFTFGSRLRLHGRSPHGREAALAALSGKSRVFPGYRVRLLLECQARAA